HAQKNDLGFKMTPFERSLLDHVEELLCDAPNKEEFIIVPSFLQHNHFAQDHQGLLWMRCIVSLRMGVTLAFSHQPCTFFR
ncbi:MAG TPA: hypothetical protein VGN34_14105, partial [Ktedonobacteraceae bacterium]